LTKVNKRKRILVLQESLVAFVKWLRSAVVNGWADEVNIICGGNFFGTKKWNFFETTLILPAKPAKGHEI